MVEVTVAGDGMVDRNLAGHWSGDGAADPSINC
jgi:hypothetical protein